MRVGAQPAGGSVAVRTRRVCRGAAHIGRGGGVVAAAAAVWVEWGGVRGVLCLCVCACVCARAHV